MSCDKYLELLSARLDGALTQDEERELEEHLSVCPDCRAAGAQLAALRGAFHELEDIPAPEGFARSVMERIRAEKPQKVIPLFRRPQLRALAGLAACAVLAVGLYGTVHSQQKSADGYDLMVRSFSQDAAAEDENAAACEVLPAQADLGDSDAAYSADLEAPFAETADGAAAQKTGQRDSMIYGAAAAEPEYCAFQNDQYFRVSYDGYTPEPGARIIGSAQSLKDFLAGFSWFDPSEVQTQYDEAYFETGRLLAAVVVEGSGSIRHQLSPQGLRRDEVEIVRLVPDALTYDMAAWVILAEVDTTFDDGDELALNVVDSAVNDGGELPAISTEDDTNS